MPADYDEMPTSPGDDSKQAFVDKAAEVMRDRLLPSLLRARYEDAWAKFTEWRRNLRTKMHSQMRTCC